MMTTREQYSSCPLFWKEIQAVWNNAAASVQSRPIVNTISSVCCLVLSIHCPSFGQPNDNTGLKFEVASVKQTQGMRTGRGGGVFPTPGMLTIKNLTLRDLIKEAYKTEDYQLSGGPAWVDSDSYDVVAKAETKATTAEMLPMLQALLGERFHLEIHREIGQVPGYWLVVGKHGSKMEQVPEGDMSNSGNNFGRGMIAGYKQSMERFASVLSKQIHVPVADKTELTQRYNFKIEWSADETARMIDSAGAVEDTMERPSLFAAIQQVGLKLERHPVPLEMIVIVHAERPTEN